MPDCLIPRWSNPLTRFFVLANDTTDGRSAMQWHDNGNGNGNVDGNDNGNGNGVSFVRSTERRRNGRHGKRSLEQTMGLNTSTLTVRGSVRLAFIGGSRLPSSAAAASHSYFRVNRAAVSTVDLICGTLEVSELF